MRIIVIASIVLLLVLHQDFWWWHRAEPLLWGSVPIGLAWHVGISLAAAGVWLAAVIWCWPPDVDDDPATPAPAAREGRH